MPRKKFLEKAVDNIDSETEKLIDQILKELNSPSEKQIKESRELLTHEINMYKESFLRGYEIILDYASRDKFYLPRENFELKPIDKKKHPELAHVHTLKLLKTKFLQEVFDYNPRMMREIYDLGCNFFHLKEFEKCIDIFTFLNVMNPTVCWFWQVLGRAWEEKNKLHEAIYAFCVAINCDLRRLEGYQDAVRCCVKSKNYETAINILDYGLNVVRIDHNPKELKLLQSGLHAMKAYVKKIGG